jgi:hypothetical protein
MRTPNEPAQKRRIGRRPFPDRGNKGCYTARMFARKLQIAVVIAGKQYPCPLEWLDRFLMRNFTGAAEFDDALPVADGRVETGLRIRPERLASAFEEWLMKSGRSGGQPVKVEVLEEAPVTPPGAPR